MAVPFLLAVSLGCDRVPEVESHPENRDPQAEVRRVMERIRSVLEEDARYVQSMRTAGTSPLYRSSYGGPFSGEFVLGWLGQRMRNIIYSENALPMETRMVPENGRIRIETSGVLAANLSRNGPQMRNTFLIGPAFLSTGMPQITRISVFLHEGRHSDGFEGPIDPRFEGYQHADCPQSFPHEMLRGKAACESHDRGSYSFQAIFLREVILNCTSCSSYVKRVARVAFDDSLERHIRAEDRARLSEGLR
jgi:hypothetical protein